MQVEQDDFSGGLSGPESEASCAAGASEPAASVPQAALALKQEELSWLLCLESRKGILLGEKLGEGTFGSVYEAVLEGDHWPAWLLDLELVVKTLRDNPFGGGRGLHQGNRFEEFILGSVRHPSLVACLGFTKSPPVWALFEKCNRGSLGDTLRGSHKLAEKARLLEEIRSNSVQLVVQLAEGISCLHGQGLLHRDLHEKNVLLHCQEDNVLTVRIADFGHCARISDNHSHRTVRRQEQEQYKRGKPHVAPELVAGGKYSTASDMWAVGFIAEKLLGIERWTGKPIFGVSRPPLSSRSLLILGMCSRPSIRDRPTAVEFLATFQSEL